MENIIFSDSNYLWFVLTSWHVRRRLVSLCLSGTSWLRPVLSDIHPLLNNRLLIPLKDKGASTILVFIQNFLKPVFSDFKLSDECVSTCRPVWPVCRRCPVALSWSVCPDFWPVVVLSVSWPVLAHILSKICQTHNTFFKT